MPIMLDDYVLFSQKNKERNSYQIRLSVTSQAAIEKNFEIILRSGGKGKRQGLHFVKIYKSNYLFRNKQIFKA